MLLKTNADINENPIDLLKACVNSLRHIFRKEDICIK